MAAPSPPRPPSPAASPPRWAGLALPAVLVATAAVYLPALGNGFTMDDRRVALGTLDDGRVHPLVHSVRPLREYLASHYWQAGDEAGDLFRPVTILTYALRHALAGDAAWAAHLGNLLLHLLAVGIVHALLRRLRAGPIAAAAGALVFGVHAVHSEVVANVVGRAELLAFCAGGAAVLLFAGPAPAARRRALARTGAAALLLIAFGSKESGLAWAPFLVVFELARRWRAAAAPLPRSEWSELLRGAAVVAVPPAVLFLWLRARMIAGLPDPPPAPEYYINPFAHTGAAVRIWSATPVLGYALWLCAWPFRLAADYGHAVFPVRATPWSPAFGAAAAALLALLASALRWRHRSPLWFLAGATFLGFSFITSNLPLPIGTVLGERLLYAPSVALSFAAVLLAERCTGRAPRRAAVAALAAWSVASAAVVLERNAVWRDDATLFLHEARNQPRAVRMLQCAARVHRLRGERARAEEALRAAIAVAPDFAEAHSDLGALLLDRGALDEAERALRASLSSARLSAHNRFQPLLNLALVHRARGDAQGAAAALEEALATAPGYLGSWRLLCTMVDAGELDAARLAAAVDAAERAAPDRPHWPLYRGLLAHRERRWADALVQFERAVRGCRRELDDGEPNGEARLGAGHGLAMLGKIADARVRLSELAGDGRAPRRHRAAAERVLAELAGR